MGRVILAFFLAVILALGLSIFSAWNWVDGQLNKQSWLTNKADTAGESWLILGSDEREGTVGDAGDVTGFRTDTILVLTKPKSGPSSLISIPRDSLVEIDQSYMKINAVAQLYNGKQLVNEVEDITGQKINHVAMVQFGGLVKVVDALGGVELCYDQDVSDRSVLPVELDCRLPYRRRHHRACVLSYALRRRARRFRACGPSAPGHQRHSEKGRIQEYASELRQGQKSRGSGVKLRDRG